MTRQRAVERSSLVSERAPLLFEAMPFIAHSQIRNRGTIGGSLAHADPAAELPAVMVALNARFRVRDQQSERWIAAEEFFTGLFETLLSPEEMLVEIEIPPLPARTGFSFQEVARRHGDYALVGVAALITLNESDQIQEARISFLSVGDGPLLAKEAQQALTGQAFSSKLIQEAAELAAAKDIDPPGDIHATPEFRRHLARVLTTRALQQAGDRAHSSTTS